MTWMNVPEAIKQTGVARATWFRRIKEGYPSKLTEDGYRYVWVNALTLVEARLDQAQQERAQLRKLLESIFETLSTPQQP
jgi:hypothetical protein